MKCYAEGIARRFSGPGQAFEGLINRHGKWNGKIRVMPDALAAPLTWRKPTRVFVNSMTDLFHPGAPDEWIAAIFGIMAATPRHTYMMLTKQADRMAAWYGWVGQNPRALMHECLKKYMGYDHPRRPAINSISWPLPNVWPGVSTEDNATAQQRIPKLLRVPAVIRFVSAEPLLEELDLVPWLGEIPGFPHEPGISWVITGAESGRGARPFNIAWARSLRDQCVWAKVPFFYKQDAISGKKVPTPELDGRRWVEFPDVPQ